GAFDLHAVRRPGRSRGRSADPELAGELGVGRDDALDAEQTPRVFVELLAHLDATKRRAVRVPHRAARGVPAPVRHLARARTREHAEPSRELVVGRENAADAEESTPGVVQVADRLDALEGRSVVP